MAELVKRVAGPAYCTGRAGAAALSEGEGTGHAVETYLMQFRPVDRDHGTPGTVG
ncbi:hypothetical protein ACFYOV_12110 [Streptomyces sp. NPDC005931]|uniref:hypothetical protein n=1 Tax=Streptomyces sp. NPDC005931 TaxID=3364737 RepID=UPI0036BD3245